MHSGTANDDDKRSSRRREVSQNGCSTPLYFGINVDQEAFLSHEMKATISWHCLQGKLFIVLLV